MKNLKIKAVLFKKVYTNGKFPILIRITYGSVPRYIATGDTVDFENWDSEQEMVYEKKPKLTENQKRVLNKAQLEEIHRRYSAAVILPDAKSINQRIQDKKQLINQTIKRLEVSGVEPTSENVANEINKPLKTISTVKTEGVLKFFEEVLEEHRLGDKYRTYRNYKTTINKFRKYVEIQLKKTELKFPDFTTEVLEKYELYLKTIKNENNTIWTEFKNLEAMVEKAVRYRRIKADDNPFLDYKGVSYKRQGKTRLSKDELDRIIDLVLTPGTSLWHCRNYFLFAFYCAGLRFGDVCLLKWSNVKDGRLTYEMDKNGKEVSIPLFDPILKILKLYESTRNKSDDFIFPLLNNGYDYSDNKRLCNHIASKTTIQNSNLKKLAKEAKIDSPISTHVARHSMADQAMKLGLSKEVISKILRHSSLATTEAYLSDLSRDAQDEAMAKLFT